VDVLFTVVDDQHVCVSEVFEVYVCGEHDNLVHGFVGVELDPPTLHGRYLITLLAVFDTRAQVSAFRIASSQFGNQSVVSEALYRTPHGSVRRVLEWNTRGLDITTPPW
jgi:hypothetical protein